MEISYRKIISVSCPWLSIPSNSDLLANGMFSFLFMCFMYITCICLGKKDHPWQITFGCQKCFPGPLFIAKFGPTRTIIYKGGPFLATGPLLGQTDFHVTDIQTGEFEKLSKPPLPLLPWRSVCKERGGGGGYFQELTVLTINFTCLNLQLVVSAWDIH